MRHCAVVEEDFVPVGEGIEMLDTGMTGQRELNAVYLLTGAEPALVESGPAADTLIVLDALGRRGIVVDRHKIELEEPLRSLGTYKVAIKVFAGLSPEVTVVVEPKG